MISSARLRRLPILDINGEGMSKSAICRLKDADYEGHSSSMLKRIAEALDKWVNIRFLQAKRLKAA